MIWKTEWTRLFVAAITACGLLLATLPGDASAQGRGDKGGLPGNDHPWKHDWVKPPGPPCPKADRPCPPGLPGGTNPGGNTPGNGQFYDAAVTGLFMTGMEPSPGFLDAVASLREGRFQLPTPVPAPAQVAVFDAFSPDEAPANTALVKGLTSRGNDQALEAATAFVTAMRSLTVQDGQLPAAVKAFNALVDESSAEFLSDPAPEFLVVHSFIGDLVAEATGTPAGSR